MGKRIAKINARNGQQQVVPVIKAEVSKNSLDKIQVSLPCVKTNTRSVRKAR